MRNVTPSRDKGKLGSISPGQGVTKIRPELLSIFNNRGYPYINTYTYELEWYIETDYMERKLAKYVEVQNMLLNIDLPSNNIADIEV